MGIGPNLILDKSIFQSLGPAEHHVANQIFYLGLPPILASEIIADLSKPGTGDLGVAALAKKFEGSGPIYLRHFSDLLVGSMIGNEPPKTGQFIPWAARGTSKRFVVFPNPVNEALLEWKEGRFHAAERAFATHWRLDAGLSLLKTKSVLHGRVFAFARSIPAAAEIVEKLIDDDENADWICRLMAEVARVAVPYDSVIRSVRDKGAYARYVLRVILLYEVCLRTSGLLPDRGTNTIDLIYLLYLPFCSVFSSSDKLHLRLAPQLVRKDQHFIPGAALRAELAAITRSLGPDAARSTLDEALDGLTLYVRENPQSEIANSCIKSRSWNPAKGRP